MSDVSFSGRAKARPRVAAWLGDDRILCTLAVESHGLERGRQGANDREHHNDVEDKHNGEGCPPEPPRPRVSGSLELPSKLFYLIQAIGENEPGANERENVTATASTPTAAAAVTA